MDQDITNLQRKADLMANVLDKADQNGLLEFIVKYFLTRYNSFVRIYAHVK